MPALEGSVGRRVPYRGVGAHGTPVARTWFDDLLGRVGPIGVAPDLYAIADHDAMPEDPGDLQHLGCIELRELRRNPAALARNGGPWRGLGDLEFATCGWVQWFNEDRIHGELNDLTLPRSKPPTTVTVIRPTRPENPTQRAHVQARPNKSDVMYPYGA